jgi:hypothetical protein
MGQRHTYDNDLDLIAHLLPSMLHLKDVQRVTDELMHQLLRVHQVNVHIYSDGKKQRRKEETRSYRDDQRMVERENLRKFFTKQMLPSSFRSQSTPRSRSKNFKIPIPDAFTFMMEFPVPVLLFQQVEHSFRILARQYENGELHDSNVFFRMTQCEGEADQVVAMASALDTSNMTYAIGQDSDYCVFGFPMDHDLWSLGDIHVQYMPLVGVKRAQAAL